MEFFGDIGPYLWMRLPLALLFGGGYIVYQLMAATRITDAFVLWALQKSRGSGVRLMLYIVCTAAILSSFIPNAITVLTLLPVLKRLDDGFREQGVEGMTTTLMCAAIYGAAIGGFASMIGSPANAILIGALDLFQVVGREQISFFNWFVWALPLALVFIVAAWGVLSLLGLPGKARRVTIGLACLGGVCETNDRQRFGVKLFWLYMAFWIVEALARQVIPGFAVVAPIACMAFTLFFLYLAFVRVAPSSEFASGPLLVIQDLFSGLPKRGLVFIGALAVLVVIVTWLGIDEWAANMAAEVLKGDMSGFLLFLLTVLGVIFLTEILSNTAVGIAFFAIAYYAAIGHDMPPLPLMFGVSVGSVCAFMTPIATPTSALAFGEMKGASLRRMLGMGLVLNLIGAALITVWLSYILPVLYL